MSDIVERLRAITGQAGDHGDVQLCNEAADEIERLRAEIDRLRSRPCPYVTGTVTHYCTLTPFTLTDAEREAIKDAIDCCEDITYGAESAPEAAATLRGLLERTQNRIV